VGAGDDFVPEDRIFFEAPAVGRYLRLISFGHEQSKTVLNALKYLEDAKGVGRVSLVIDNPNEDLNRKQKQDARQQGKDYRPEPGPFRHCLSFTMN
jgi:hypothetical protein